MVDPVELPAEPVFVLCNARSGSTLLRYLLDTHPDIACPAETKVSIAARALLAVQNDLARAPTLELLTKKEIPSKPSAQSVEAVRDVLLGMTSGYLGERGKTVWCDKSLDTVHHLEILGQLFPRARYICLHRHAMDVVASLLESCRWGYGYFDIQPYVARRWGNVSLAFAEYWTVRTNIMLKLQQSATPTHTVHYEHLVRDPAGALTGILEFLGLARDDEIVKNMIESALHVEHQPGAADWKIAFAGAVEQRSVERGRAIPQQLIKDPVREQMNALLSMMRYPIVEDDWNHTSDVAERVDRALLAVPAAESRLAMLVDGLLAPRLVAYAGPRIRLTRLTATHGDGDQTSWIIDSEAAVIRSDDGSESPPLTVTTRAEVIESLVVGGMAAQSAQRLEMLAVTGADDDETRDVSRLLNALLTA